MDAKEAAAMQAMSAQYGQFSVFNEQDEKLRLECLKLATYESAGDARHALDTAKSYYLFVKNGIECQSK